jgi:hypothetical protein
MDEFEEIFRQKGFPMVGAMVRCRRNNSLWRVMEREVWHRVEDDPDTAESRVVPSFYLSFWRIETGVPPRVGQMLGHLYTLNDNSFEAYWEVITYH